MALGVDTLVEEAVVVSFGDAGEVVDPDFPVVDVLVDLAGAGLVG